MKSLSKIFRPALFIILLASICQGQQTPSATYLEAAKLCVLAADHGDTNALTSLISMAVAGSVDAQKLLGAMYASGKGVPNDNMEALKWYRKAADQGDADAQGALGAYYKGRDKPPALPPASNTPPGTVVKPEDRPFPKDQEIAFQKWKEHHVGVGVPEEAARKGFLDDVCYISAPTEAEREYTAAMYKLREQEQQIKNDQRRQADKLATEEKQRSRNIHADYDPRGDLEMDRANAYQAQQEMKSQIDNAKRDAESERFRSQLEMNRMKDEMRTMKIQGD